MKYVSIDIETTGLDRVCCRIIEFAAVIADSKDPEGKTIGLFQRILKTPIDTIWDDFARNLNGTWYYEAIMGGDSIQQEELIPQFCRWLLSNQIDPVEFFVAGKNYATFDKEFLERMIGWGAIVKPHRRVLDPAMLYFDPERDMEIPNTNVCCERARIMTGKHRALTDAKMVVQLLHKHWYLT